MCLFYINTKLMIFLLLKIYYYYQIYQLRTERITQKNKCL